MTNSPFVNRIAGRNIGHNGRVSERKTAKRMGGVLTPASGAMSGAKGDIKKGKFLIEAKATKNDSMSVKKEWLCKIYQEALEQGKEPALSIVFTDEAGNSGRRDRWVAIPEALFLELTDGPNNT